MLKFFSVLSFERVVQTILSSPLKYYILQANVIMSSINTKLQSCLSGFLHRRGHHRNCPICRLQVTAANDSWVVSDAPTEEDMATYILNMVDEAGQPHRP